MFQCEDLKMERPLFVSEESEFYSEYVVYNWIKVSPTSEKTDVQSASQIIGTGWHGANLILLRGEVEVLQNSMLSRSTISKIVLKFYF